MTLDAETHHEIQNFLNSHGGVAVVNCYATWCSPCNKIESYIYLKSQTMKIPVIGVDIDKAYLLAKAYRVEVFPTFLVLKDRWNNIVDRILGED